MKFGFTQFAPMVIAFLACASRARASLPVDGLQLEWNAPSTCPSLQQVEARTAALQRDASPRHAVIARADVSHDESVDTAWHLELETHVDGEKGKRSVDAKSCDEIADDVSLILALALDGPSPAAPTTVAAPAAKSVPADVESPFADTHVDEASPLARRVHLSDIAALPSFDVGTLPGTHGAYAVGFGWAFDDFRLEVLGGATLQRVGAWTVPGSYTLVFAQARGCYSWLRGTFSLDECVGVEGGSWSAVDYRTATAADPETSRKIAWYALRTSFVAKLRIATLGTTGGPLPLFLRADVDGALLNTHTALKFDDGSTFETRKAPMRFSLGLAFEI